MTIIMDSREEPRIQMKLESYGVAVERRYLEVGDYWIGELAVERKTIDDFFNSIYRDRRYYTQLYNLMRSSSKPVVYVIGTIPQRPPVRRVGGRIVPINIEREFRIHRIVSYYSYGVPVIQVHSEDDFIADLLEYHNKSGRAKTDTKPLEVRRKPRSLRDVRVNIFGSIPGLGRATANKLADEYTVEDIVRMSRRELVNLKVGDRRLGRRGETLYRALHEHE